MADTDKIKIASPRLYLVGQYVYSVYVAKWH